MPYIIKNDFQRVITTNDLAGLIDSNDDVWLQGEESALEEVKSYLRNRYDVAAEFDIQAHDPLLSYEEGDRVIVQLGNNQGIYRALSAVPDGVTEDNLVSSGFFALEDNRNAKLVTSVILVILYENYTRLNGTEIPAWLQIRYDGGDFRQNGGIIGYLKMIQKGTVEPDIPLRPDVADGTSQTGNRIAFGVADDVVNRNTSI